MKIGIIQLTSVLDFRVNLEKIRKLLKQAKEEKIEAVFLPEVFYSMSNMIEPTPYLVEQGNEHFKNIQSLAKDFNLYLLGGSVATKEKGKIKNRNFNFDPKGKLLETYDKIHMFACDLSKTSAKVVINEAKTYTPGTQRKILQIKNWKIGLSICFDLRFPEMYRQYYHEGANLLSISSAFTVPTGKAHWHTLLRARAIENQSYVVAAAQYGVHNERVSTYGHSLIINPWGEILADAGEGEKLICAEIDLAEVKKVRERLLVPVDK